MTMRLLGLAMLVALAGCAGPYGTGRGLPEVTMKRGTGDFVPPARGYTALAVRSFELDPDGAWQEVPGATCQVSAGSYRAGLVTPARLVLPDLGPDAPPIAADCGLGAARGRDAVGPAYSWPTDTKPDAWQRFSYSGWWRGYEKSGPLRYPDLAVGLTGQPAGTE